MNTSMQLSISSWLDATVFWGCVCIIIIMGLFPPHIDKTYKRYTIKTLEIKTVVLSETITYRFLGVYSDPDASIDSYTKTRIAYGRLFIQWFLVVILGASYQYFSSVKEE